MESCSYRVDFGLSHTSVDCDDDRGAEVITIIIYSLVADIETQRGEPKFVSSDDDRGAEITIVIIYSLGDFETLRSETKWSEILLNFLTLLYKKASRRIVETNLL